MNAAPAPPTAARRINHLVPKLLRPRYLQNLQLEFLRQALRQAIELETGILALQDVWMAVLPERGPSGLSGPPLHAPQRGLAGWMPIYP